MQKLWILLILALILSGCADSIPYEHKAFVEPVSFWYGLWHGLIIPFSWLCSLFSDNIAIYASYNNGGWYDFGFVLGVSGLIGSS